MTNPVRSFRELMKRQARAALAVSGAEQSHWNGRVRTPRKRRARGVAGWDGSLTYSYERIKRPLREMFRQAGRQHDEATLLELRRALRTVLHENAHLLSRRGADRRAAAREYTSFAAEVLEEGISEAWAYDRLNEFIDELGLEQIAPGIRDVEDPPIMYARYHPAARELAAGVGERIGISAAEMLDRLNREDASGKWEVLTDALFESSDLPRLVPPAGHADVKAQIRAVLQEQLERVADLTGQNAAGEKRARYLVTQSALVGQDAYRAADELIRGLETDAAGRAGIEAQSRTMWVATAGAASPAVVPAAGGPAGAATAVQSPPPVKQVER